MLSFLSAAININIEGREAHSLIANVAGKLLMLQKDRPAAERRGKKVECLRPLVLILCFMEGEA